MKKISIVFMIFCLINVTLSAQAENALSIEEAMVLYEDDLGTWDGKNVIERVKELLPTGINATDSNGNTLLIYASYAGYTELVKSLIVEGADIDVKADSGWTALVVAAEEGHTETVQALITAGAATLMQKTMMAVLL